MFQNNPLLAQLKQDIQQNLPRKEGRIKATERGFGFLEIDGEESIFIPPLYLKKVLDQDKVIAIIRTENDKTIAEPEKLIEKASERVIAQIKWVKNFLNIDAEQFVHNTNVRASVLDTLDRKSFIDGDWVIAHLKQHPLETGKEHFTFEISERICAKDDLWGPWLVSLAKLDLPRSEPLLSEVGLAEEELLSQQGNIPELDQELIRENLCHLPFITIDGESTKDMDDALYIEQQDDDFKLTVAIADPSAYIAIGTPLDQLAKQRGFSCYLPNFTIPMLPRILSEELCSLKEQQNRLTLCCEMHFNNDGQMINEPRFFAAWIKSAQQLNYTQVSDYIEGGTEWQPNELIANQINILHQWALARIHWRQQYQIVFDDRPDFYFILDEQNKVSSVKSSPRRIANRIIEEAMICANISAGNKLKAQGYGLFNTHEGFSKDKLEQVTKLLQQQINYFDDPAQATTLITQPMDDFNNYLALQQLLMQQSTPYLRLMLQKLLTFSLICTQPKPHFGMGLDIYATWTSPIRKYGDLINHRLLKAILVQTKSLPQEKLIQPEIIPNHEHTDLLMHQRKQQRFAERQTNDWLYGTYLQTQIANQQQFKAQVVNIVKAGIRVCLINNGANAFIPFSLIIKAEQQASNSNRALECDKDLGVITADEQVIIKLGDHINVLIKEVRVESRSIIAMPLSLDVII